MAEPVETIKGEQSTAAADIAPQSPLFESDHNDSSPDDDDQHQPDTKERRRATIEIGATQVDERANMLYTRCYRGRNSHSQRLRIREREEKARRESEESGAIAYKNGINDGDGETDQSSTADRRRRSSTLSQNAGDGRRRSSIILSQLVPNYFGRASVVSAASNPDRFVSVTATVVEEADAVVATELGLCERNWKKIAVVMTALLVILSILLSILSVALREEDNLPQYPGPTASPTFDSKPTLSTVQDRGFIRCGLNNQVAIGSFHLDLCRSVASVVIGDADSYEITPTTFGTRWEILNNRGADLLIGADTHTIEREVRLPSAGSGFTFSAPYYYDGMTYAGNETFIECAERKKRYGICSSLSICVYADGTSLKYVSSYFPRGLYTTTSSTDEMAISMENGTCNVLATEMSLILGSEALMSYSIGNKQFTKGPHAIVTRNTDQEFSDVVNWVLQALFYGEEQGLTKSATLCAKTTNVTSLASELNYLNAVYCVGSYKDLYYFPGNRGMNRINNGTNMHHPIPFGALDYAFDAKKPNWDDFGQRSGSTFSDIIIDTKLNCGVFVQSGNDTEILAVAGLSEDCKYIVYLLVECLQVCVSCMLTLFLSRLPHDVCCSLLRQLRSGEFAQLLFFR